MAIVIFATGIERIFHKLALIRSVGYPIRTLLKGLAQGIDMTTRRSMIMPSLMILGAFVLSACVPSFEGLSRKQDQQRKHILADGEIVVVAPKSYCVDPSARASRQFVLLTHCDLLGGIPKTDPEERAVLTVSSGDALGETGRNLPLASALGASSALSSRVPELALRFFSNADTPRLPGASASHWRGILKVNNRIVTLAAYGPEGGDVLGTHGKDVLEQLARQILAASPDAS